MGEAQFPSASIAIPVRDEARSIAACLDAVLAQDFPPELLEVIVVDGGSRDRTREIVESVAARSKVPIHILDNPAGTTPAGLNRALARARGEYFVRVDGHSAPAPTYVRRCVEAAEELGAALAGGWVQAVGSNAFGRAVAAAFASPFAMGNAASWRAPVCPRQVASVPCGAYRARELRAVGGFDEEQLANQDYEVNYRLRERGGTVWVLPDVWFRYEPRDSVRRLARQFYRYGFYKARTMVKHPASVRPRHLVPAALVVAGVALLIGAAVSPRALVVVLAGACAYVVAVLVASLGAARRTDASAAVRLPFVFATMHLCWGAGSLAGLLRFAPRRRTIRGTVEPLSA